MTAERSGMPPVEAPLSGLERMLIDEFLHLRGYDAAALAALLPAERDAVLKEASLNASAKLAEIESRAHYVADMHRERGEPSTK